MKKSGTRIIALVLSLLMLLAMAGCGKSAAPSGDTPAPSGDTPAPSGDTPAPSGDTPAPSDDVVSARDTLTIATSGDPGTLMPTKIAGSFTGIIRQYMEVLVDYKADGTPVWVLATDIEEKSDSEWIIHCREGVTFTNGNPFNADDVIFTFNFYLSDPMSANFLSCFDMENTKKIDDYTIDLALSSYSMQQMGSLSQIYIFDAESFNEDDFVMNPVGTGPYKVEEYVINSHVYFTANENYWNGQAKIKNLHYKVFNEDAQMINAIQSGTVDVSSVPLQDVEFAKTLTNYDINTYYNVFAPTISFNMSENSLLSNKDARLAVCYAANRQAMADLAYFGYASVLHYPVSQHCLDYTPDLDDLSEVYSIGYNVEKAKEYAEKAGLVGKTLVAITNGASVYVTEAEILQANLKEIGVTLDIKNYDAATYFSVSQDPTQFDIALYAIASPQGYAVGMMYEYVMWGPAQFGTWENYDAYLELGKKAVATSDPTARQALLKEMSVMFEDGLLWYGICDQMAAVAINKELGNVEIWNSGGMRYVDWYWKS